MLFRSSKELDEKADEILKVCSETFGFLFSMDRAVISPSSPMLNFPFHLIKDDKYLFEEVRVTFLPHADIANVLKDMDVKDGDEVLAYSDPKRSKLVYVEEEIESIAKHLNNPVILKDPKLEDLIKYKCKILHISAHAYQNLSKAILSYIDLGDRLYLKDILKLRILDLVSLSACETAVHEFKQDSLGMPTAFFAAGANKVISTLWKVYDKSTAFFFKNFYKKIDDTYSAYTRALKKTKNKFKKLYFWGGFVYYGL